VLTFAAYQALGGLEGALRARAEGTFATLSPAAQAALSAVIARLVQVHLDGAIGQTRTGRASLDAIAGASALVDAFVAARLFVMDRGADGQPVVGVAHEALLREWPRVSDRGGAGALDGGRPQRAQPAAGRAPVAGSGGVAQGAARASVGA
jgi:hypothetical protein